MADPRTIDPLDAQMDCFCQSVLRDGGRHDGEMPYAVIAGSVLLLASLGQVQGLFLQVRLKGLLQQEGWMAFLVLEQQG